MSKGFRPLPHKRRLLSPQGCQTQRFHRLAHTPPWTLPSVGAASVQWGHGICTSSKSPSLGQHLGTLRTASSLPGLTEALGSTAPRLGNWVTSGRTRALTAAHLRALRHLYLLVRKWGSSILLIKNYDV